MKRFAKFIALIAMLTITSCASIVSSSSYPVSVTSSPEGVPVTITNDKGQDVSSGVTPFTVMLKAGDGWFNGSTYYVEGPRGERAVIDSSLDGWYFGNLVFGGLLGIIIVDPLTGAMWKLPDRIEIGAAVDLDTK